jgi:hypothetical protein
MGARQASARVNHEILANGKLRSAKLTLEQVEEITPAMMKDAKDFKR